MARVRNKTTNELMLKLNGSTFRPVVVKPDETVEIPDDIFKRFGWPDTVWDVVEQHRHTTKKAEAAADSEEK